MWATSNVTIRDHDSSKAWILNAADRTTALLAMDDVTDLEAIESLAVSIFDRATKATLAGGEVMPRGGFMFTSNKLAFSKRCMDRMILLQMKPWQHLVSREDRKALKQLMNELVPEKSSKRVSAPIEFVMSMGQYILDPKYEQRRDYWQKFFETHSTVLQPRDCEIIASLFTWQDHLRIDQFPNDYQNTPGLSRQTAEEFAITEFIPMTEKFHKSNTIEQQTTMLNKGVQSLMLKMKDWTIGDRLKVAKLCQSKKIEKSEHRNGKKIEKSTHCLAVVTKTGKIPFVAGMLAVRLGGKSGVQTHLLHDQAPEGATEIKERPDNKYTTLIPLRIEQCSILSSSTWKACCEMLGREDLLRLVEMDTPSGIFRCEYTFFRGLFLKIKIKIFIFHYSSH